jgi:conjugal transfer pilus assembly protein TraD
MLAYSRKVRVLLHLLVAACLLGAILAHGGAAALPYGGTAAPILSIGYLIGAGGAFVLLLRYRRLWRTLTGSERFILPVDEIPEKPAHTYLARGFAWEGAHVERLQSLTLAGVSVSPGTKDAVAGNGMLQGVGAEEIHDLFIPDSLLNQHLFVLGAPGSGKTRFLELLIEQAIARGEAVVVIDPKGDERLLDRTFDSARRHGREKAFRTLALPYPYQSARYNPVLHYTRPSEIADRVALVLPKGGDSEAFRNYAWTFTNIIASALHLLGEEVTLAKLNTYCFHDTWQLVRKLVLRFCPGAPDTADANLLRTHYRTYCAAQRTTIPELDALIGMASMNPDYFGKISSALRPILGKLTTKGIGYLLCPGDVEPPPGTVPTGKAQDLSWEEVDSNRLIVYFFLGSLIGEDTASGVARMALSDLQSFIGRKYAYQDPSRFSRMTVVVDEVADALASESVNILNKARGAGLSMILAGQSIADLEVALRSHSDARRALANVGSFVTLRAANPEDAKYFSDKCGSRPLRVISDGESYEPALFSSGRSNIDDFAYRSSRQVGVRNDHLVPTWAIDELPRFHFFATWAGQTYKAELPLLSDPDPTMSARLKEGPPVTSDEPILQATATLPSRTEDA